MNTEMPIELLDDLQYYVCEYSAEEKGFYVPTRSYENIYFTTPTSVDKTVLQEMERMLATLKEIN